MFDIIISMVLYNNSFDEIKKIINEIRKINLIYKICIVDNSPSSMIGKELVAKEDIDYIKNEKNYGFGKGHNVVINRYKDITKVFLLLNPDIEIKSKDIEKACNYLINNKDVGLLSPKVKHENVSKHLFSTCHLIPSPAQLFLKRFCYVLFKEYIDNYNLTFMDENEINFVPNLSGCCLFVKSKIFNEIGGFDERYFLYMEDVDFVRRVAEKYKTLYFPQISVAHTRNSLSYKEIKFLLIHIKSAIKYFNKWGWFFDKKRNFLNKKTLENLIRRK